MPIAIIINPISGGARPDQARARAEQAAAIAAARGESAEVFVTERPGHARELAKAAVARHARLVVAWGGDGTINEIASALAFEDVPLAIMPAGSGNGLARELGIDARPERALAEALGAEPRPMDIGELDGHPFVNIAGIGFDAYVAARFNEAGNRRRGLAGYAAISARALARTAPRRIRSRYRTSRSGRAPSSSTSPTRRSSATTRASRRGRPSTTACSIWWSWRRRRGWRRSGICRGCSREPSAP